MTTSPDSTKAGRREWTVPTLPCLLISMDLSVLHLAVPALSADLRPSGTELLWIVDVYSLHARRLAHHHGQPRRPHRPQSPARSCFRSASPVFTLATDMTIASAPPERAGAASAISETSTELGAPWASPSSEASAPASTEPP